MLYLVDTYFRPQINLNNRRVVVVFVCFSHLLRIAQSLKIYHLFSFSSVLKNLYFSLFFIFSSGSHIPLIHSHLHFIIKLIYKSRTHIPLTFSIHFLLHFLKFISSQMVTNYGGRVISTGLLVSYVHILFHILVSSKSFNKYFTPEKRA